MVVVPVTEPAVKVNVSVVPVVPASASVYEVFPNASVGLTETVDTAFRPVDETVTA